MARPATAFSLFSAVGVGRGQGIDHLNKTQIKLGQHFSLQKGESMCQQGLHLTIKWVQNLRVSFESSKSSGLRNRDKQGKLNCLVLGVITASSLPLYLLQNGSYNSNK